MDRVGIRCSFSHAVLLSDILNVQISTSVGVSVSVSVSVCSFSSNSFFNWVISVFLSFSLFPALTQKIPAPTIRMAAVTPTTITYVMLFRYIYLIYYIVYQFLSIKHYAFS